MKGLHSHAIANVLINIVDIGVDPVLPNETLICKKHSCKLYIFIWHPLQLEFFKVFVCGKAWVKYPKSIFILLIEILLEDKLYVR